MQRVGADAVTVRGDAHADRFDIALRPPSLAFTWHTNSSARWNVEDARGRDVALAQMQIGDPREGQPRRTALARFIAAAPDVIAYLLERVRVAEARIHEAESRTEVVGG